MARFDRVTVYKIILWFVVLFAMLAVMALGCVPVNADSPKHGGSEHGNGRPPAHAKAGGKDGDLKWNEDPDDNGKGPDRGDGTVDDWDWNNGCGNDPDRADDNEGWCGRKPAPEPLPTDGPVPVPTPVVPIPTPTPILPVKPVPVVPTPTCKIVLWGDTPELFEAGVDVHDPRNERFVLAEAHGYLEYIVPVGFRGTVLWYRVETGHSSIVQGFVCDADEIVLYEPFSLGDNME